MKKIALGLITLALTVAMSMSVMATMGSLTDEHPAWELIGTQWSLMGTGSVSANARAWSSDEVIKSCNRLNWPISVSVHASVAQWIEFSITGTRYTWLVRKPGIYAANSISAIIASNGDVGVAFSGFGDLASVKGDGTIPVWYAAPVPDVADPGAIKDWIPAAQLTRECEIGDTAELHKGYTWKLWNKIEVVRCNTACEYQNDACITLVLKNQKPWIDPTTGYFKK